MILRGKFLRAAALAAVLVWAAAGSAAATTYTWNGGTSPAAWHVSGHWSPTGIPGAGDTAVFESNADINGVGGETIIDALHFKGNATLTLANSDASLTAKKVVVDGGLKVNILITGNANFKIQDGGTAHIDLADEGSELKLESGGAGVITGAGDLKLSGKGRLTVDRAVTGVANLEIADGGTLKLGGVDVLPDVKKLVLGTGVLDLRENITLKTLSASAGSRIKIASHKKLSVKPDGDHTIEAAVSGDLFFDLSAGAANDVKLNGSVDGTVIFKGAGIQKNLELSSDVKVDRLEFDGSPADKVKLTLKGNNAIGALSFKKLADGYPELLLQGDAAVGSLEPDDGATSTVSGGAGKTLTLKKIDASKGWELSGRGVALSLPSGSYPHLSLSALGNGTTLQVPVVAAVDVPLLTVKDVTVAADGTLTFTRPASWPASLEAGDTVTLLKIDGDVTLNGTGRIVGDPADDEKAKIEEINSTNALKELILTVKAESGPGTPPVPEEPKIDNTGWTREVVSEDRLGNVALKLRTTLTLDAQPKAVEAVVSGMAAPGCELLDGSGQRVLAVEAAALPSYTLVLNCSVSKAEVMAGARVQEVKVTTADGKVKSLPVDKKVKDMKPKSGGGTDPLLPDPKSDTGKGGGGCDAGLGGLALVLAAAFLPRRRA